MPVELPVRNHPVSTDMIPIVGSTAPSIIDSLPLSLVLLLASPYLAGRAATDAIKLAHRVYQDSRFSATLDMLGEDARSVEDCQAYVEHYKQLIGFIASKPVPCVKNIEQMTISLKPSMFAVAPPASGGGSDPKLDDAFDRIREVVDCAFKHNLGVTIEAEDHRWIDFHLETYFSLVNAGYSNVGTVMQTRLFRTASDIKRFDERMRVRLLIGIYNEPSDIAYTEKPIMKDLLVSYAGELLDRGTYVELATHDTECLESFFTKVAIPRKISPLRFETQFLLGVPRRKLQQSLVSGTYFELFEKQFNKLEQQYIQELTNSGILVRLYLPYGKDEIAAAYCKRRLKANPNLITFGIKNLLHIQ
ncbi:MAG: proline dehydrogenase family protein [Candidatus Melainabacteria bacterium]|nr:proline dehydrogenase family protein [Candidatus Melainabacteria bacterium]